MKFYDYFEELHGEKNSFKIKDDVDIRKYFPSDFFSELEASSSIYFNGFDLFDPFQNVEFKDINIYFYDITTIPVLKIVAQNCNIFFNGVKGSPGDILIIYPDNFNLFLKGVFNEIHLSNVRYKKIEIKVDGLVDSLNIDKCNTDKLLINGNPYDIINSLLILEFNNETILKDINIKLISFKNVNFKGLSNVDKLVFEKTTINNKLLIDKCIIKTVDFSTYKVNKLKLNHNIINTLLIDIEQHVFVSLEKKETILYNLYYIKGIKNKIGYLEINQSNEIVLEELNIDTIDSLQISNLKCSNFYLNNNIKSESSIFGCIFENLIFNDFYSSSSLKMKNILLKKDCNSLKLINSHLGNVLISPSFFEDLKQIYFTKSSIQDLRVTNFTNVPSETLCPQTRDSETNYLILYRELKALAQNYGDSTTLLS